MTVAERMSGRQRINIASAEDTVLFNSFLDEWLASLPARQVLSLDVTNETLEYEQSVKSILEHLSH